jgi:hypothetical protein
VPDLILSVEPAKDRQPAYRLIETAVSNRYSAPARLSGAVVRLHLRSASIFSPASHWLKQAAGQTIRSGTDMEEHAMAFQEILMPHVDVLSVENTESCGEVEHLMRSQSPYCDDAVVSGQGLGGFSARTQGAGQQQSALAESAAVAHGCLSGHWSSGRNQWSFECLCGDFIGQLAGRQE